MPRKPATETDKKRPALQFEPPLKKKKLNVEINISVAEMLERYPAFVKATTSANPSVDDVLEKALEKVFKSDKAFQAYLAEHDSGNRQPSTSAASPTPK